MFSLTCDISGVKQKIYAFEIIAKCLANKKSKEKYELDKFTKSRTYILNNICDNNDKI